MLRGSFQCTYDGLWALANSSLRRTDYTDKISYRYMSLYIIAINNKCTYLFSNILLVCCCCCTKSYGVDIGRLNYASTLAIADSFKTFATTNDKNCELGTHV